MSKVTIRSILLRSLKKDSSHIGIIYYHMLSILPEDSLEYTLKYYYSLRKDNKWFSGFHKSIRQTDFFGDICYALYDDPQLSKEETKELEQLNSTFNEGFERLGNLNRVMLNDLPKQTHPKYLQKYGEYFAKYSIMYDELVPKSVRGRRHELRTKLSNLKKVSINGKLDSVLWNVISIDHNNILYDHLIDAFEDYLVSKRKPKKLHKDGI